MAEENQKEKTTKTPSPVSPSKTPLSPEALAKEDETLSVPEEEKKDAPEQAPEQKEESKPEPKDFSFLKPGMTVKVHQKIKEAGKKKGETKERVQIFEGMILAIRGAGVSKTITVRKTSEGVGVEKIFPLHLPTIIKIEPVKQAKVRRAKLYYLRDHKKKLKERKIKK